MRSHVLMVYIASDRSFNVFSVLNFKFVVYSGVNFKKSQFMYREVWCMRRVHLRTKRVASYFTADLTPTGAGSMHASFPNWSLITECKLFRSCQLNHAYVSTIPCPPLIPSILLQPLWRSHVTNTPRTSLDELVFGFMCHFTHCSSPLHWFKLGYIQQRSDCNSSNSIRQLAAETEAGFQTYLIKLAAGQGRRGFRSRYYFHLKRKSRLEIGVVGVFAFERVFASDHQTLQSIPAAGMAANCVVE